jgi:hypothetical protein
MPSIEAKIEALLKTRNGIFFGPFWIGGYPVHGEDLFKEI